MNRKSKIIWFEPIVFLFFGAFHLHRIWSLIDRYGYSDFWLSVMNDRGWFYYALLGTLSILCIAGIVVFMNSIGGNYWWRWVYIFGGGYVLFDLFAVFTGIKWWRDLLEFMFDINNPYWNVIWGMFILLGLFSFVLGICVIKLYRQQNKHFTIAYKSKFL